MNRPDLALNNLQWLIYYKTKLNQNSQVFSDPQSMYMFEYHHELNKSLIGSWAKNKKESKNKTS